MINFSDVSSSLAATCRLCDAITTFSGKIRYRLDDDNKVVIVPEFQCQDCGDLTFSMPDNQSADSLLKRCACGGQYRKDKPLFCPVCRGNKTELNVSE